MPARFEQGGGLGGWRPLTSFHRIFDDFDRLFEDMQRSVFGGGGLRPSGRSPIEAMLGPTALAGVVGGEDLTAWAPRIEVRDTGREYVILAELPGVDTADVEIEVTDDGLVLRGEMRQEQTEDEGGIFRTERRYGRFFRLIPLPQDVASTEQATAEFNNGMLAIRLPKAEQAQQRGRRIQIVGAEPIGGGESATSGQAAGEAGGAARTAGEAGAAGASGGAAGGAAGGQRGEEGRSRRSG